MNNITYTKEMINKYIDSKQLAWAPSSIKSERARLHAALDLINQGAQALYEQGSKRYKMYALKTLFIRAGELAEFVGAKEGAANSFKAFLKDNARLFKNAYTREVIEIDYVEARKLIETGLEDGPAKKLAKLIMQTGLRADEALRYDGSGFIVGKGSKKRVVMSNECLSESERASFSYSMFHKALAKINLKPHTLRKLVATQLVNAGAKEADLLTIMGWSNILTAASYLQPKNNLELKTLMQGALNNGN